MTIGTGATLSVAAGASVLIQGGQTITDNGAMNVTGASIGFVAGYYGDDADPGQRHPLRHGSNFYTSGGNYGSFTLLQVNSGGELIATNTTFSVNQLSLVNGSVLNSGDLTNDIFNLPIYVPFQDVALLANNQSFQDINIIAGTMTSGQTLSLIPIGTRLDGQPGLHLPGQLHGRHGGDAERRYRHQRPDRPGDAHRRRGDEHRRRVDGLRGRLLGDDADRGQRHADRHRLHLQHLRRQL